MVRAWFAVAAIGIGVTVGCEEKKESAPPAPASPATGAAAVDQKAVDAAKAQATQAADAAKAQVDKTAAAAKAEAAKANDAAKAEAAKAADAAKSQAADLAKQAEAKISEVWNLIKEKKLDAADTALKSIEAKKASLPASIQSQIDRVRKALDTAKAGAAQLQGIPGIGK